MAKKKTPAATPASPAAETAPAPAGARRASSRPKTAARQAQSSGRGGNTAPESSGRGSNSTAPDSLETAADHPATRSGEPRHTPSYEEIAEAAYHRFLQRGGGDGRDFDDWIAAEQQLRSVRDRST